MATAADLAFFRQQQVSEPENKKCFECRASNPQWVNVWHGIYVCLECSGVHRSLGTHISFVRSVSMDGWPDKYMSLMKIGGNAKCRAFFQSKGIKDDTPIREKFAIDAAFMYKDMQAAEAKGEKFNERDWKPPEKKTNYSAYGAAKAEPGFGGNQYQGIGASSQNRGSEFDAGASLYKGWSSLSNAVTEVATATASKSREMTQGIEVKGATAAGWNSVASGWGGLTSWAKAVTKGPAEDENPFGAMLANVRPSQTGQYTGVSSQTFQGGNSNDSTTANASMNSNSSEKNTITRSATEPCSNGWDDEWGEAKEDHRNPSNPTSPTSPVVGMGLGRKKGLGASKGSSIGSLKKIGGAKKGE